MNRIPKEAAKVLSNQVRVVMSINETLVQLLGRGCGRGSSRSIRA